jgi:hypothetical protein
MTRRCRRGCTPRIIAAIEHVQWRWALNDSGAQARLHAEEKAAAAGSQVKAEEALLSLVLTVVTHVDCYRSC